MILLVLSMHATDTYSPFGNWYYTDRSQTTFGTALVFGTATVVGTGPIFGTATAVGTAPIVGTATVVGTAPVFGESAWAV